MDLLEYQGKQLFAQHGVPVPAVGKVCRTVDEVVAAAEELGGMTVIKSQVKVGGRGKAGGVKLAKNVDEAREHAQSIFGLDIKGHIVEIIYVEPASDIAEEYYLSVMHDRVAKGLLVICSRQGGVDIEEVNRTQPDAVVKASLTPSDIAGGMPLERAREIVTQAALPEAALEQAASLLAKLVDGLVAADATLMEINPLILTEDGRVIALDAKVTLDGNAMFRHPDYAAYDEALGEGDPQEAEAKAKGINYIKLEGAVGVLGNGAGLVMASLDVVAQAGGAAADFLDIGGGADAKTMAESLGIVLSDPQVKSVLVNIFGGITRCDLIAKGVLGAMDELGDIPSGSAEGEPATSKKLVVRLDGTNAVEGRAILEAANHPNVIAAATMSEAAEKAVALANA